MVSTLALQQVCRSAVWCLTFLTCDSSGAESCPLWSLSDYRRTDRHWERSGLIETGGEKEVSIVTTDSSLISVSSYLCTLHYLSVSSCLTTAAAGPGAPMFTPRPSQLEKQEQLWCCSVLLLCPWLTVCERVCVHPCVCVFFVQIRGHPYDKRPGERKSEDRSQMSAAVFRFVCKYCTCWATRMSAQSWVMSDRQQ